MKKVTLHWTAPDGRRHSMSYNGRLVAGLENYNDLVERGRTNVILRVDGDIYLQSERKAVGAGSFDRFDRSDHS